MTNRWRKSETVTYFIFLGSKITANGTHSHEIKRELLLGRKAMTNLLLLCHFSRVQLLVTPWTAAYQAPLCMGFFQARALSGVPLPSPMTNLDSILKSRDITLPTKVHIIRSMVFPAVMYGCESRTIKKTECQRIDVFKLWCWRRLFRVLGTAR